MVNEVDDAKLSYRVDLPGGQLRLVEAIVYIASKCASAERFGKIKLNKILWRADFEAFAIRGVPVTGRAYQRLKLGPAPVEMAPVLPEMVQDGLLRFELYEFGDNIVEERPVAISEPNLRYFSADDLQYLDEAIDFYWDKTGRETSDQSHGVAWKTREDNDPMPYELAFLSDSTLSDVQKKRLLGVAHSRGVRSE